MRWFAAATISFTLLGAVFGCGSDGGGGTSYTNGGDGGVAGSEAAGSSGMAMAGKAGASAGSGGAGNAGSPAAGSGGDAGSPSMTSDAGSAGTDDSAAGSAQGGSGGGAPIPTAPSAPTALVLQVVSATSVHLAWTDHANNETGFNVYWSATAVKPATPNLTVLADVLVATADGLTANQEYNFWVEAYNDVGASTDITDKATPIPVPAQPTSLVITGGATDASLNWNDAATTETGYRVYFSSSNVQPAEPAYEIPANSTMYTVPGSELTPYITYYYWVVAYNQVGNSAPATGTGITGLMPVAPTVVTVDPEDSVWYVKASWIDNSLQTASYNIYWSIDDTKPAQPGATVDGSLGSYNMTQRKGDQTYRFWVESVNAKGKSTATKGTATKKTYELVWSELFYDIATNTIRQSIPDTFGLLGDADASSGLWGYHTANTVLGTPSALGPSINWIPANAGIDLSVTQFFWSEARTPKGSQFSVRSLTPPGPVTNFAVTPSNLSAALSWTAATNTSLYQVLRGSTNVYANATSLGTTGATTFTATGLNPGLPYTFWVRALAAGGIGGTGLPSPTLQQSITTTGTQLGNNLSIGKTAVASTATGDVAKNVIDGNIGTRWQANVATAGEWIYVNLGDGNAVNVTDVKLVWEAAYAKSFDIQLCAATCDDMGGAVDGWAWSTAYNGPSATLAGFPYYQLVHFTTPGIAQFVRMKAKTLGSAYGASLYEFEVYSAP